MCCAASRGYKNLIDFLISKGVKEWDAGLYGSISFGNLDLIKFFIEKGAKDIYWGIELAKLNQNDDIVELLEQYLQ